MTGRPAGPSPTRAPSNGLAIVGAFDGTHIGASLERAAARQRIAVTRFDTEERDAREPAAARRSLAFRRAQAGASRCVFGRGGRALRSRRGPRC